MKSEHKSQTVPELSERSLYIHVYRVLQSSQVQRDVIGLLKISYIWECGAALLKKSPANARTIKCKRPLIYIELTLVMVSFQTYFFTIALILVRGLF